MVVHSPTPSIVSTAARSNGEGKNALAAWLRWCSENSSFGSQSTSGASDFSSLTSRLFWKSFSLSHSGSACRNDVKPRGAKAR